MIRPEQYTTDVNDMPAPTWAQPGLYWNPEYLRWRDRLDGLQVAPRVEPAVLEPKVKPPRKTYELTAAPRVCEECGVKYQPRSPRQRICGAADCKAAMNRENSRRASQRERECLAKGRAP